MSTQPLHKRPAKRARCDELPVAVKIFKREADRTMRDKEFDVLGRLRWNNNVPTVVRKLDVCGMPALIVSPAGDKVLPLKGGVRANRTDFVKLLHVLIYAHDLGICHRDVKPDNIFKDDHGRIILGDWGSAAETGTWVVWTGTRYFYEEPEQGNFHSPRPEDDLVALVRSVHLMYTNQRADEVKLTAVESSLLWREGLLLARKLDYDGLRDFFNRL